MLPYCSIYSGYIGISFTGLSYDILCQSKLKFQVWLFFFFKVSNSDSLYSWHIELYTVIFLVQFLLIPQGPDTKFMSSGQIGSFLVISFFLVLMILSICFVVDNSSSDSLKLLHFEICTYRRPHKSLKKTMSFCRQVWNVCDILQLHTINIVDDHGIMWYSLILRICALSLLPR